MIGIGIVGIGFMGVTHFRAIDNVRGAKVTAICTRDRRKLKGDWRKIQGNFGESGGRQDVSKLACYEDIDALLADPKVDLVDLCLPTNMHVEWTMRALAAGKHVLLEKPIAVDPEEGRRLVAMAGKTGRALVVAQNPPYWSHCRYLRDRLRRGDLGEIEGVSINWVGNALGVLGLEPLPDSLPGVVKPTLFRGDAAQNGGGFLVDGGSHLLCELLWCTGLRVAEVSAHMDTPDWDLRVALALTLENGGLATLSNTADLTGDTVTATDDSNQSHHDGEKSG